jgi:hypothetical protein
MANPSNLQKNPVAKSVSLFVLALIAATCWGPLAAQPAAAARPEKPVPGTRALAPNEMEAARATAPFTKAIHPVARFESDHVAAGISLRNRGGGVINLRGAEENGVPVKAFLYWDILDSKPASPTMSVSINGVDVVGNLIGQGADPCWGATNNFAYRAEVPLYLLYIGINGDYKVAGFPSSKGTGSDPWFTSGATPLAEGATLVIFYRAPTSRFHATYVYDTPIAAKMFSSAFHTVLGGFAAVGPNGAPAKFTLVGADGQSGGGLSASAGLSSETSWFQGVQIAGPGSQFDTDSDWNGQDTQPLNQLWDTRTHIVSATPGSTTAAVQYVSQGDCLVTVAFVLSF